MYCWLLSVVLVIGVLAYRAWARKQRKVEMLESALTDAERAILARDVPLVARMPRELRDKLEGKICLFLDQVRFQGCNGLEVTEAMELSIAAPACLFVVNMEAWYDNLTTVLIYPSAFKSKGTRTDGYIVTETETVRTGESWSRGPVILSWAHSAQGAVNAEDVHNVALHEFAHQFDDRSGWMDGVPLLARNQSHATWVKVFRDGFERHVALTQKGARTVIDPCGATGHEVYFATAVEVFFEKAETLQEAEPEVYDQLLQVFQIDPAAWEK